MFNTIAVPWLCLGEGGLHRRSNSCTPRLLCNQRCGEQSRLLCNQRSGEQSRLLCNQRCGEQSRHRPLAVGFRCRGPRLALASVLLLSRATPRLEQRLVGGALGHVEAQLGFGVEVVVLAHLRRVRLPPRPHLGLSAASAAAFCCACDDTCSSPASASRLTHRA